MDAKASINVIRLLKPLAISTNTAGYIMKKSSTVYEETNQYHACWMLRVLNGRHITTNHGRVGS